MRKSDVLIRKVLVMLALLTMAATAFGITVKVSLPSETYNGTSPVHVVASATSGRPITGWVAYVDGTPAYQGGRVSAIDTNLKVANGNHQLVLRAWDTSGAYDDFTSQLIIGNNGLPTPPSWAVLADQIQNRGGWNSCHDSGCAGGSGKGAFWMAQHQGNPSRTGSSTEFFNSGVWANALWWNKFGAQDSAHNFLWDFWIYLDSNYLAAAQTTEFDIFQFVSGYNYMMGTQCNVAAGVWDTWNAATGHWIHTSIKCPKFNPNAWHHIQMYVTTDTTKRTYTYHTLVVDDQSSPMNITGRAGYTGWNHNIGTQWQLDVNSSGVGYHEWVDNAKLWTW